MKTPPFVCNPVSAPKPAAAQILIQGDQHAA